MLNKLRNAWRSKTIWFNTVLLSLLPIFEVALQLTPQIREFLPEDVYKVIGLVAVVGNTVLRFMTSKPLEAK
jgi:hypothetical protein